MATKLRGTRSLGVEWGDVLGALTKGINTHDFFVNFRLRLGLNIRCHLVTRNVRYVKPTAAHVLIEIFAWIHRRQHRVWESSHCSNGTLLVLVLPNSRRSLRYPVGQSFLVTLKSSQIKHARFGNQGVTFWKRGKGRTCLVSIYHYVGVFPSWNRFAYHYGRTLDRSTHLKEEATI